MHVFAALLASVVALWTLGPCTHASNLRCTQETLQPFRDASPRTSTFSLTVEDTLQGTP
jgi:hypothetical protein